MRSAALDLCLILAVASVWLGVVGFLRLTTALDRLHCASFVNVAGGLFLLLAAIVDEGLTVRSLKFGILYLLLLTGGAVAAHAAGRALLLRSGSDR